MKLIARCPLKLILFGEHSVLVGSECIALCINKYAELYLPDDINNLQQDIIEDIKKDILTIQVKDIKNQSFNIDLSKPNNIFIRKSNSDFSGKININYFLACGLGSSAAISLLCSVAINKLNNKLTDLQDNNNDKIFDNLQNNNNNNSQNNDNIFDNLQKNNNNDNIFNNLQNNENSLQNIYNQADLFENVFHGRSSGVDCATIRTGGLISFKNGNITSLDISYISKYKLIIYNSGISKDTKKIINGQLKNKEENYKKLIKISDEAYSLISKDFKLKDFYKLIRSAQDIFEDLNVVPELMKNEVRKIRKFNIECKITGAGNGGHLFTLVDNKFNINDFMGWEVVEIDVDGLVIN